MQNEGADILHVLKGVQRYCEDVYMFIAGTLRLRSNHMLQPTPGWCHICRYSLPVVVFLADHRVPAVYFVN